MLKIKSVSNFLEELGKLNNENESIRFFRGHSDCKYLLKPSIYRNNGLISNEYKIIRDALTYCPSDFNHENSNFLKLVKLQHYGYPTRLLDLTSNALVALYFSVQSDKEKGEDGEVIVFDIPYNDVKYEDSDKVSILSALAFHDSEFQDLNEMVKQSKKYREIYQEIILKTEITQDLQGKLYGLDMIRNFALASSAETTNDLVEKHLAPKEEIRLFNDFNEIRRLIHIIRADKPYFSPIIDYKDLGKVIAVRGKLNNRRVERQHGSFLLFGIDNNKIEPARIPSKWIASEKNRLIIDKESKQKILKELTQLGISRQTLFPELEAQANYVKEKYIINDTTSKRRLG